MPTLCVSALVRACLPLLVLCAPLHAQAPAYARPPGDTLRYHELTETYTRSPAMAGEYTSLHDARVAITFAAGDSARAWYEALRLENRGGRNGIQKAGAEAEGLPFVLAFGPRGVDTTVSLPEFPEKVRDLSDLRLQFADFFPRLPADGLRAGLEWADTMVLDHTTKEVEGVETRIIIYRVLGDSVIDGVPVTVIEEEGESTARTRGNQLGMSFQGSSTEHVLGRFYFAAGRGLMVRRTRRGVRISNVTFSPSRTPLEFETGYTSTIELLTGPRE